MFWILHEEFLSSQRCQGRHQVFLCQNNHTSNVQEFLETKKHSFEQSTARRASAAAVPQAAWVKANIRYSYVIEKIGPLEAE